MYSHFFILWWNSYDYVFQQCVLWENYFDYMMCHSASSEAQFPQWLLPLLATFSHLERKGGRIATSHALSYSLLISVSWCLKPHLWPAMLRMSQGQAMPLYSVIKRHCAPSLHCRDPSEVFSIPADASCCSATATGSTWSVLIGLIGNTYFVMIHIWICIAYYFL